MNKPMSNRAIIRVISFTLAAVIMIVSAGVMGYSFAMKYKTSIEQTYQNALNQLSDRLSDLTNTLTKSMYANTSTAKNEIYTKLIVSSQLAKDSLSLLPVNTNEEETIQKYLSQISDIATYLQKKYDGMEELNDSDEKLLLSLRDYSKQLALSVEDTAIFFTDYGGQITFSDTSMNNLANSSDTDYLSNLDPTFRNINGEFTNYPSLIYDGPFSDHLLQATPKLTKNCKEYSVNEARYTASMFLNCDENELKLSNETKNNLPLYHFITKDEKTDVSITKFGGYVESFHKRLTPDEPKLSYDDAMQKAEFYLKEKHFDNMSPSYGFISNSVATFNFAYNQDGVICYNDLIKVGVATDSGEIVSFSATGYIMNHCKRNLSKGSITIGQASKNLSDKLTIKKENTTLIPTGGNNEVLCYEFLCNGEDDDTILVYINANTGLEENIYILLESENGYLTI
ncbi:MAG: germination protein YpeB [Clostridia bacterium]|nr:germination protein YpeB [Clostridia bacterium]